MNTTEEIPRDVEEIESDIARTRASLNRRMLELERRLSPSDVTRRLRERQPDLRAHPEWIAVGAIVTGAAMALIGWRRSRRMALDEADLEDVVIFDVCEDLGDEPQVAFR